MDFDFENDIRNRVEDGKVLITIDPEWYVEKEITKIDVIELCKLYGVNKSDLHLDT